MADPVETINRVCAALSRGGKSSASRIAERDYPFEPRPRATRSYTPYQSLLVFRRDGFVDRYTGKRLVFPGTLRLLGMLLPDQFPWHPHGKLTVSHIVHWELWPTIDHLVPVARGGQDEESNWVTTSMLKNQAKGHWTVEELGWKLHPGGELESWDGLTSWFLNTVEKQPDLLSEGAVRRWHSAARRVEAGLSGG